jgi:hypothetical protein
MTVRVWRCRRVKAGVKCGTLNLRIKQRCTECGAPRPKASRPKHMAALDLPYEWYVEQFGERCGICGKGRSDTRKLDRDHEHKGDGSPRGLLCAFPCNTGLKGWMTAEWLRRAAAYLEQHEARKRRESEAA